jgi:FMN phosphatase YigB (HAD superfamily)
MKTILVDAVNSCIIPGQGIFKEMQELLNSYPNPKIILTGAKYDDFDKYGLNEMPYEVFTLEHDPEKTELQYYQTMLVNFRLAAKDAIYFEHNPEAVETAQEVGITTFYYDKDKRNLVALKDFIDANL